MFCQSATIGKYIPQRTCVECRRTVPKCQLVRLVRTVDGGVAVDASGKSPGRGAYLCATHSCWTDGIAKGRLEWALRTKIDERMREHILIRGRDLCDENKPLSREP